MLQLTTNICILIIGLAFLILWTVKNWVFPRPKGYEITLLTKKRVSYHPIYSKSKLTHELHSSSSEPEDETTPVNQVTSDSGLVNYIGDYLEEKRLIRRIKKS